MGDVYIKLILQMQNFRWTCVFWKVEVEGDSKFAHKIKKVQLSSFKTAYIYSMRVPLPVKS